MEVFVEQPLASPGSANKKEGMWEGSREEEEGKRKGVYVEKVEG